MIIPVERNRLKCQIYTEKTEEQALEWVRDPDWLAADASLGNARGHGMKPKQAHAHALKFILVHKNVRTVHAL